ncbi:MAG: HNH endonuclease [Bdellovibrionota bacterium]
MNLKHLTDATLDLDLLRLVRSERVLLAEILHHLREVENRRLYSAHGFSSLFAYATERLGYSEDQAARRISAMRLLKEIPEIEQKIESGALTLTHLSKAQTLFRQEKKAQRPRSVAQKLFVLSQLESSSKRDAEKVLERESFVTPVAKPAAPPVSLDQFGEALQVKLTRLLDLKARSSAGVSLNELIDQLADLGLEKWDPIKKAERANLRKQNRNADAADSANDDASIHAPVRVTSKARTTRYIEASARHALFIRDRGCCGNCGSTRNIEIDHIVPFALGGSNDLENLRLVCRSCNQRSAIEQFGVGKIQSYLKAPTLDYFPARTRMDSRKSRERRTASDTCRF